jgi:uncharacterized caspase-like protein
MDKFALLIGNSWYEDPALARLKAPDPDVLAFEEVLRSPTIGGFKDVVSVINGGFADLHRQIARFYANRHRGDLLLLYFSGHGIKDEAGQLYLAVRDTERALLAGTAISSRFLTGQMDTSASRSLVVMLDCSNSRPCASATKGTETKMDVSSAFEGSGRALLTATDATQYEWEGDRVIGDEIENSLFTHFVIEGLKTGAADRDEDGFITVDELYEYVYDEVRQRTHKQMPSRSLDRASGNIVIAESPKASTLPKPLVEDLAHPNPQVRLEAVRDAATELTSENARRAAAAKKALEELADNESRKVASAAAAALKRHAAMKLRISDGEKSAHSTRSEYARQQPVRAALGWDIFISYAKEDCSRAEALASALKVLGLSVWWDRSIPPGKSYPQVIDAALKAARCVIVLWSKAAVSSDWVNIEAAEGAKRRILIPAFLEEIQEEELSIQFRHIQAASLVGWIEKPSANPDCPWCHAPTERHATMIRCKVCEWEGELNPSGSHAGFQSLVDAVMTTVGRTGGVAGAQQSS